MPKRTGNLYQQLCSLDALYAAYLLARKTKRSTLSVNRFENNLGSELQLLANELQSGEYRPKQYRHFWVYEPKPRIIAAPAFRDVVVQHAIYKLVYQIFDRSFIFDSYGCRVAKGTHRAADRAQRYLRECRPDQYLLQMDIRKFYYSISHDVLERQLASKIKDTRMLDLMRLFIKDEADKGVPIGNLLSQMFALIYLNPLDHFVKRELKIKRYVRYVDDFVLFGLARQQAVDLRNTIAAWLKQNLCLELSRWTIKQIKRGLNFVGFRAWQETRLVRKHSLHNFNRAMRDGRIDSLVSIIGNSKQSASYRNFANRLQMLAPELLGLLPYGVQDDLLQLY